MLFRLQYGSGGGGGGGDGGAGGGGGGGGAEARGGGGRGDDAGTGWDAPPPVPPLPVERGGGGGGEGGGDGQDDVETQGWEVGGGGTPVWAWQVLRSVGAGDGEPGMATGPSLGHGLYCAVQSRTGLKTDQYQLPTLEVR